MKISKDDRITINNATVLLEECLFNGSIGTENLYSWYLGEKELIERTIEELIPILSKGKGPYGGPTPF